MLFDLTTAENAINSLCEFIGKNKSEVFRYLLLNKNSDNYKEVFDNFIEEFNINIDEDLTLDRLEIKAIHITTGNDNGKFIKENGLKNLREVVKSYNPLSNFLQEQGIKIDIDNEVICYKGKLYPIEDESKYIGFKRNLVYHKLFDDYMVNGFYYNNNPLSYGGGVSYRPEFIVSIGKLIGNEKIENEWIKTFNQCYIIEYKTNPYNFESFNYVIDGISTSDVEENKDFYIKYWLIMESISIILSDIQGSSYSEIFSYANRDYSFPSSEIIRIIDVTNIRDERTENYINDIMNKQTK
ncbi:hypothetical protein ACV3Z6_13525 [Clostridium perfringens]|uniref:hypothetical protein n=2 Tax=Clostridium perfringens TaxID=1502 RepID=UPI0018E45C8A|nr:hypothetical protein [Clostridium perfringens]MBI6064621.1 hypothetical protein [Clostridium perfringens]MDN4557937.1 hypothetical protein [Clostridium perfringens]MDT7988274.1 hypothetical protein [Clostridium perfringens]MDV5104811.1 hypothetical protein [Clostridium perfringens]HAT4183915.1 hypothetical protein [Clostridium perfringens]